jgi:hypothetical protein
MVKTKKVVKSLRKTKKISGQRGGVHCENKNSMSFFTWAGNSCYLDTLLVGWLHYAGPDFIQNIMTLKNEEVPGNKKNLLTYIIEIVDALSLYPQNPVADPVKKITEIRNKFRRNLQACPIIRDEFGRLTDIQDPAQIFNSLTNMLNINDIIIHNKYVPFLGYSPENIKILKNKYPEIRKFDTLEEGIRKFGNNPHPVRADKFTFTNMITLPIYLTRSPGELVNKELEHQRTNNQYWYINEKKYVGTVNSILPINIERLNQDNSVSDLPVNLETKIGMDDGNYELVSIICYVPGHYVGYYKCHDTDEWIFYNDLGVSVKGGGKCEDDILEISKRYINYINVFFNTYSSEKYTSTPDKDWFIKFRSKRTEYYIYNKIYKHLSKNREYKAIIEAAKENEMQIDIKYGKLLFKLKANALPKWFDDFKNELLLNTGKLFRTLIKKVCDTELNNNESNNNESNNNESNNKEPNNNESNSAYSIKRTSNLFMRVGSIDTWEDKAIPGYVKSPRESATLLFYHKIE